MQTRTEHVGQSHNHRQDLGAHCGVYIEGYDLGITADSPLQQPNITACQASCQAEDGTCAGFTFVHPSSTNPTSEGTGSSTGSGDCYLKTAAGASSWKLQQELALQPAGKPQQATQDCRTYVTAIKGSHTCLPPVPENCNQVKEYLKKHGDKEYKYKEGGKWSLFCNIDLLVRAVGHRICYECVLAAADCIGKGMLSYCQFDGLFETRWL